MRLGFTLHKFSIITRTIIKAIRKYKTAVTMIQNATRCIKIFSIIVPYNLILANLKSRHAGSVSQQPIRPPSGFQHAPSSGNPLMNHQQFSHRLRFHFFLFRGTRSFIFFTFPNYSRSTSHLTFKRSTYISNTLQYRPLMELYAFGHVIHSSIFVKS